MIGTIEELAGFIRLRLTTHDTCRIFCHVLRTCWSLSSAEQAEKIQAFAAEHGWEVKIHEPAAYGIVADFRPRKSPGAG
ncbi:MAG TPA: hypothetical protein VK961_14585 [Chthoniobacter sp.]|nr:hypothetical protein [Chthoniobacter sp.]